jgi:signal transduction histidine kinase
MAKLITLLAVAAISLLGLPAYAAAERGTEDEAVALVKKAILHYDKLGHDKAMAELSRSPGPFVDRDLYVTVFDLKGNSLANINPRVIGRNMIDIRDNDGKYILRERLEAAQKHRSGWQDYKFYNPVSRRIEPKRMYWERHGDLVFASGAYREDR